MVLHGRLVLHGLVSRLLWDRHDFGHVCCVRCGGDGSDACMVQMFRRVVRVVQRPSGVVFVRLGVIRRVLEVGIESGSSRENVQPGMGELWSGGELSRKEAVSGETKE